MKKRVLAVLLTVVMVLGMFPMTAMAAGTVDSGTCGDNLTWTLDSNGQLTISGTGPMENFSYMGAPWFRYAERDIKTVVVKNGVTTIGELAFQNCNSLASVSLPASVTTIEYGAFYSSAVVDINLPENLKTIGTEAFEMCKGLRRLEVPASVRYIGPYACSGCDNLTSVTIVSKDISIEFGAFRNESTILFGYTDTGTEEYARQEGIEFYALPRDDGWEQRGGNWYYYKNNVMVTGWQKISGSWYYFKSSGAMVTGWYKISGSWYYFKSSGAMVTGWYKISGSWYYFKSSGAMATGWQKIDGAYYYFASSGAMKTGWIKDGGKWYYLKSSGAMTTGWYKISGSWYYFTSSGTMKTGWLQLGSNWYYLKSSGEMVTGDYTIGGILYHFDENGVWIG